MNTLRCVGIAVMVIGIALPFASHAGAEGAYRWIDEQGRMHYSDQVPPDEAKHERARLNQQGREVERIEAAKTSEQRERDRRLGRLRAEQQRLLAEQQDRDLALLRSYRNEDEMRQALHGKLDTIESMIKVVNANRQRQEGYLQTLQQRAADTELRGQIVPKSLRENIDATRRQIAIHQEKIKSLEANELALNNDFERDIQRFRQLQTQRAELDHTVIWHEFGPMPDDIPVSAVNCRPGPECSSAWEAARAYIKAQISLPLFTETDRLLQTVTPQVSDDIAVIVVRIDGRNESTLFLDLRCHPSSLGEEWCTSRRAREIRTGFIPAVSRTARP